MADVINSAFDTIGELDVAEILEAPELFEKAIEEELEGEQAYKALFKPYNTNAQVYMFKEDMAPELEDGPRYTAEGGEIHISDPSDDREEKFAVLRKFTEGIRVTWEQREYNKNKDVQREILARAKTIRRYNGLAALAALNNAPIEVFPVATAWSDPAADIRTDIGLATDLVLSATDVNGRQFSYEPDIFWANPLTINRLKRNKSIAADFIGDMASENPIFKKIGENPLLGGYLQVLPDMSIPVGEAYLGASEVAGFEVQKEAPITTVFYEENGQSGVGGSTMTWRSDYIHVRDFAVHAPKSIVKLTGLGELA